MIDGSELDTLSFPLPLDGLEGASARSSKVRIDFAARTHTGKVRATNEDHFLVARTGRHLETLSSNIPASEVPSRFSETGYLFVVADGMGGASGGEVASRMAIATLVNIVIHVPDWILRLDEEHAQKLMERASRYYRQVNDALRRRAHLDPSLEGMGTTMTGAYSLGDDLFVAHVGDSRAYLFRDSRLQRLTHDQTHAQALADAGVIRQQDVARHRLRHVLTSALGGSGDEVRAEIQRLKLCDGDRLLLCTDGLTEMVEDRAVAEVLGAETSAERASERLVESALDAGGRDNVTVVVARYAVPDAES